MKAKAQPESAASAKRRQDVLPVAILARGQALEDAVAAQTRAALLAELDAQAGYTAPAMEQAVKAAARTIRGRK